MRLVSFWVAKAFVYWQAPIRGFGPCCDIFGLSYVLVTIVIVSEVDLHWIVVE
jgi:hypothetical protein